MDGVEIQRRLCAAIAWGLAIGSTACGSQIVPDDDGASEGTAGTGSTTHANGSSVTAGPTSPEGTTQAMPPPDTGPRLDLGGAPKFDLGETPKFDLGEAPKFDLGVPSGELCDPIGEAPVCDGNLIGNEILRAFCVDTAGDASCDELEDDVFLDAVESCLPDCDGFITRLECDRFALDEHACCNWVVVTPGQSCPGRPFLVDGHARLPTVVAREGWARTLAPSVDNLSNATRQVLARAWAAEGCCEAASVASFSRFVLQLLSLAAPASLVTRAHRAMADEVEHARAFFGLASAYGGSSVGPDTLAIEGSLQDAANPIAAAVSVATEGCIAETISAMQLALAASRAEDPSVRTVLAEIAEQELQHAELAWSALAWMMRRGPSSLRAAVADAFVHAQDAVPRAVSESDALDAHTLRRAGRLDAQQRLDTAQRALARCVAPAAAELLRPWTSTAPPPANRTSSFDSSPRA